MTNPCLHFSGIVVYLFLHRPRGEDHTCNHGRGLQRTFNLRDFFILKVNDFMLQYISRY